METHQSMATLAMGEFQATVANDETIKHVFLVKRFSTATMNNITLFSSF
jgi:hypothetical protein